MRRIDWGLTGYSTENEMQVHLFFKCQVSRWNPARDTRVRCHTCRGSYLFSFLSNMRCRREKWLWTVCRFIKNSGCEWQLFSIRSLLQRSQSHICETNLSLFFVQYCAALLLGGASLHENTGTRGADKLTFDLYVGAVCGLTCWRDITYHSYTV